MPEIAEVALMADAIREILSGQKLSKITILGGRYLIYKIKNEEGHWVNKVKVYNEETNQYAWVTVNTTTFPGGQYLPELENFDLLNDRLPLNVQSVNVKGKFCWIQLDDDWYIGITFGMTGGIYYEPNDEVISYYSESIGKKISKTEYTKHFHIKFETLSGSCFYFGDPRRFGTITLSTNSLQLKTKLNKLGPDMLTNQPISDLQFIEIFRRPKFNNSNICKVLMGQEAISGVGNYIKAETLYECGINPWALVSDLTDQTLIQLHQSIRQIANLAYKGHGASLYTYTGTRREKGSFQNLLKVYDKKIDFNGFKVIIIPDKKSPDKRATHYVIEKQTIGIHRDPLAHSKMESFCQPHIQLSNVPKIALVKKKIPITLKLKSLDD